MEILEIANTLTYVAAAFVLFFLGKSIYRIFHPKIKINHELVEKDNVAFAVSLVGYYVGLICAIGSAIVGPSNGIWVDLFDIFTYGLLAVVLLNLSAIINDKLVLNKFNLKKEILEDRNLGTGVIEAGNFIGTGFIIYGSVVGEGGGYITAIIFWALGQVLLLIASKIYSAIVPYNVHDEIEKDNVAAGVAYSGALISIAYLVMCGIESDFESWQDHLITIGVDTGLGFILLPVVRFVTDKILLPTKNLTDEIVNQEHPNVGAALIEAFAYLGGAVLIGFTL